MSKCKNCEKLVIKCPCGEVHHVISFKKSNGNIEFFTDGCIGNTKHCIISFSEFECIKLDLLEHYPNLCLPEEIKNDNLL